MKNRYVILAIALAAASLVTSGARAWDQFFWDLYIQRSDTITPGAGNARDVNAATHVIDPWPRYVGNRRIPGNGERMVGAIERYRDVSKLPRAPRPIVPLYDRQLGVGGASSAPAGAGTPQ